MPTDSAANPPQREATGQTQLPLSRVRKIIALDPDVNVCSSNAAFVITLATELFLQHLATEGHNMVKLDRKPRKNLQYRDLANAVSRIDRLEFLEDTIPNTVTFGKIKGDAAKVRKALTGETVAGLFGHAAANGGAASGAAHGSDTGKSGGGGGSAPKSGGNKKGRSSTGVPTAISALMTDIAVDSAGAGETAGAGTGAKRQQVLPFSILNGDENSSSFMSARGGSAADDSVLSNDGVDSGVAAAAALAQAAAASGTSPAPTPARPQSSASGMALDDADPDAQLAQDMRRVNDDGDDGSDDVNGGHAQRGGRSSGRGRYSNGDVQMHNN